VLSEALPFKPSSKRSSKCSLLEVGFDPVNFGIGNFS
jgi:hypothetical protein